MKTETCITYLYGGCGGTENLFQTELACLAKCNKPGKSKDFILQKVNLCAHVLIYNAKI